MQFPVPDGIAGDEDITRANVRAYVERKARPAFAYSLPVHPVHTRRDRVASLPPCRLYGAAIQSASPLGPGRALTLPCGWNNAGQYHVSRLQSVVVATGVTQVSFSNLEIRYSRGGGVIITDSQSVLLEKCTISDHGQMGVNITGGHNRPRPPPTHPPP